MESLLTVEHGLELADDRARHGHQASLDDGLGFVNTLSYDKGKAYDGLTDAHTAIS